MSHVDPVERRAYMRAYYHQNKERLKAQAEARGDADKIRARRKVTAVSINATRRKWREANKETHAKWRQEYHAKNRDHLNAKAKARRDTALTSRAQERRKWRAKYPEKQRRLSVLGKLRRYGLDPDAFAALFAAQGGCCAICKRPELTSRGGVLVVDHCHVTNIVRGLLCAKCNSGLGFFSDEPALLKAACLYLGAK